MNYANLNIRKIIQAVKTDTSKSFQYLQTIRIVSSILIGVLLVKFGISDVELSKFEWFLFLVNTFSFFWATGLKNAVLNYYPKLKPQEKTSFYSTTSWLFLLLTLFAIVVSIVLQQTQIVDFKGLELFFVIYFIVHVPSTLIEVLMIIKDDSKTIFNFSTLVYGSHVFFVIIGYLLTNSINGAIYGLIIWALLRFLFFLSYGFSSSKTFDKKIGKHFLVYSIPLIMYV